MNVYIYNNNNIYGKNDFAERSKILLDTYLKIILLDYQSNFFGILKIMNNAKNFNILATSLNFLRNYFDTVCLTKACTAKLFSGNR